MLSQSRDSISPAPTIDSSETEKRKPRRLSKPRTNKSSGNLRLRALQQLEGGVKSHSTSELPIIAQPVASHSRELIKSHIFGPDIESRATRSLNNEAPAWKGVAMLVQNFEARQSDESLATDVASSPKRAKRPFSALAIFGARRTSNTSLPTRSVNHSKDQLAVPHGSPLSSLSSSPATELQDDGFLARTGRRASFAPGVATRHDKPVPKETLERQISAVAGGSCDEPGVHVQPPLDEWKLPPRIPRPETPSDLELTQLGGLRLGSLHVVNGRASPAPSELSRLLIPKPAPAPRRDASSEYGGSEYGDVPNISTVLQEDSHPERAPTPVTMCESQPTTPASIATHRQSDLTSVESLHHDQSGNVPTSPLTPSRLSIPRRKPVPAPDQTAVIARAYMAELPDSPYSIRRSPSPTNSVVVTTSERTEFDDCLFDVESIAPSVYSDADAATDDTYRTVTDSGSTRDEAFQSALEFQRYMTPTKARPAEPILAEKDDSGYSSNVSLRDDVSEEIHNVHRPERTSPSENSTLFLGQTISRKPITPAIAPEPRAIGKLIQTPTDLPQESPIELRQRDPRPVSILKQSRYTAPELPTFANIKPAAPAPIPSTQAPTPAISRVNWGKLNAARSPKKASCQDENKPRKLQKRRPSAGPVPIELITVQGAQHSMHSAIPPIPAEALSNLCIRSQEVPELENTYNSMHHVRNQVSVSSISLVIPDVRFPSPGPEVDPPATRPRAGSMKSVKRFSFIGRKDPERRTSQSQETVACSQAEAMAIIGGRNGNMAGIGASPYEAVAERKAQAPGNPKLQGSRPGPRSMMDDQTAAEVARMRSRMAIERETRESEQRRLSFNDRGGIPGKFLRPASIAPDAPPMPPLPHYFGHEGGLHDEIAMSDCYGSQDVVDHQRWSRETNLYYSETAPPQPPQHSPRPSFLEPVDSDEAGVVAPPPPSHSPRPVTTDPWAAQAIAWKSRRMAAKETLHTGRMCGDVDNRSHLSHRREYIEESPYPEIPLRHTPGGNAGPNNRWEPVDQQQQRNTAIYRNSGWDPQNHHQHRQPYPLWDYQESTQRSLPVPCGNSYWANEIERPRSRASQVSNAASLAESLHPADVERSQPPPQFGRYSGGMSYAYDKESGFGGSAGTRSFSGVADAARKGMPLRASFGVDLGDVPIIAGLKRI